MSSMSVNSSLGATPASGAIELRSTMERSVARSTVERGLVRDRTGTLGLLAMGVMVAGGAVIAVSAGNSDTLLPESVHPIPSWLAGPFGNSGPNLAPWAASLVLATMFAAYLVTLRCADRLSGRSVLAAIAALNALLLLAPPLLSTDIFSYQLYGRMGTVYGANPYVIGPHAILLDPLYPFVGYRWVSTPTVYGPLFTLLSYPLAAMSIAANALAYKAIAALSSLALVTIVWNSARVRGLDPVKTAVFVGLNPLLLVFGVGGGHNDLLMLAALALGAHLLLRGRDRAGAGTIVAAAGVKLTAGLLLPFALADPSHSRANSRRELLLGTVTAAVAMGCATLALFGTGPLHLLSTIQKAQASGTCCSLPQSVANGLGLGTIGGVTGLLLAGAFLMAVGWLVRRVAQGRLDWLAGAGWAMVALLATATSLLPWYVAWVLPFAALGADRRLQRTALGITGIVLLVQLVGFFPHTGF
jgi:alpha-1,6-mannosyltransferase